MNVRTLLLIINVVVILSVSIPKGLTHVYAKMVSPMIQRQAAKVCI